MPLSISRLFKKADIGCDYIPVVSTVSNTVDILTKITLFVVCAFSKSGAQAINKNRYFKHLKQKPYAACFCLLFPIINIKTARILKKLRDTMTAGKKLEDVSKIITENQQKLDQIRNSLTDTR